MQPSRIHHVGLPVTDLDISVAWYREALGLTHEAAAGVPEGVAFMVAPTGERLELLAVDVQPSTWDGPIAALRAGVPHTAWTVDDLDAAHARAVEAGGRSVWTPRDTPEPGLRIAFVADPDGNLVELLSRDGKLLRPELGQFRPRLLFGCRLFVGRKPWTDGTQLMRDTDARRSGDNIPEH